jgi:hypothetical protein
VHFTPPAMPHLASGLPVTRNLCIDPLSIEHTNAAGMAVLFRQPIISPFQLYPAITGRVYIHTVQSEMVTRSRIQLFLIVEASKFLLKLGLWKDAVVYFNEYPFRASPPCIGTGRLGRQVAPLAVN